MHYLEVMTRAPPEEDAEPPTVSACHAMETSDGQEDGAEVRWQVKVELQGDLVSRRVWRGEETLERPGIPPQLDLDPLDANYPATTYMSSTPPP